MQRPVASVHMDAQGHPTAGIDEILPALASALAGTGPALLALPAGPAGDTVLAAADPGAGVDDDVALLLATSGSSGQPRVVELGSAALLASAQVTHDRLGGAGRWLLSLPLTHVAGWQVLVRGLLAGTAAGRRYTALVPTQLLHLLDDPAATAAAASLDAVLLGGAACPPALRERAAAAGVHVVTGYGMTETCGGCVYDGVPLDGVRVAVDDDGRVHLAGPVLARGYRDGGRQSPGSQLGGEFSTRGGARWFVTTDAGRLDASGRLEVLGRLDDVLVTGGENVAPAAVETVVTGMDGVHEALVVGVPDATWGQAVVAVLVPRGQPPTLEQVRAHVAARLGRAAAPRHLVVVADLPRRDLGKPDRRAAARLAAERVGAPQ